MVVRTMKSQAVSAVGDDLSELGYRDVAPPEWLDLAATEEAMGGVVHKVVGVFDLSYATEPYPSIKELCQHFDEWSQVLRGASGMATMIVVFYNPSAQLLQTTLESGKEWYCAHIKRIVYDANARVYWHWQPMHGIQSALKPPS